MKTSRAGSAPPKVELRRAMVLCGLLALAAPAWAEAPSGPQGGEIPAPPPPPPTDSPPCASEVARGLVRDLRDGLVRLLGFLPTEERNPGGGTRSTSAWSGLVHRPPEPPRHHAPEVKLPFSVVPREVPNRPAPAPGDTACQGAASARPEPTGDEKPAPPHPPPPRPTRALEPRWRDYAVLAWLSVRVAAAALSRRAPALWLALFGLLVALAWRWPSWARKVE